MPQNPPKKSKINESTVKRISDIICKVSSKLTNGRLPIKAVTKNDIEKSMAAKRVEAPTTPPPVEFVEAQEPLIAAKRIAHKPLESKENDLVAKLECKNDIKIKLRTKAIAKLREEYKKIGSENLDAKCEAAEGVIFEEAATKQSYHHKLIKFVLNLRNSAKQLNGERQNKTSTAKPLFVSTFKQEIIKNLADKKVPTPIKKLSNHDLYSKLLSNVASVDELEENCYPIYDPEKAVVRIKPSPYVQDLTERETLDENEKFCERCGKKFVKLKGDGSFDLLERCNYHSKGLYRKKSSFFNY